MAFVIVALCTVKTVQLSVVQAQPDITIGPRDHGPSVLAWIFEASEDTHPPLISEDVVLHRIPGHSSYRYAVIGGQRLVVDAATRAVVYSVD